MASTSDVESELSRMKASLGAGPALVHVDAYRLESLAEVDAHLDVRRSIAAAYGEALASVPGVTPQVVADLAVMVDWARAQIGGSR